MVGIKERDRPRGLLTWQTSPVLELTHACVWAPCCFRAKRHDVMCYVMKPPRHLYPAQVMQANEYWSCASVVWAVCSFASTAVSKRKPLYLLQAICTDTYVGIANILQICDLEVYTSGAERKQPGRGRHLIDESVMWSWLCALTRPRIEKLGFGRDLL